MNPRFFFVAAPLALLAVATAWLNGQAPAAPSPVHMAGIKSAIKLEQPLDGFLRPLNGNLKLRATEVEFQPGAEVGDHLHAGPGVRIVLAGELVFVNVDAGEEFRVPAGGYFYEGGDINLRAQNRTAQPARMVVVEVLSGDWQGSAMVPLGRRNDLVQEGAKLEKKICAGN